MTDGLYYSETLLAEGFEQQDKILTINGEEPRELSDAVWKILIENKHDVQVLRGDSVVDIHISDEFTDNYFEAQNMYKDKKSFVLMAGWLPCKLDTVWPDMPAYAAGLKAGDSIVAVAGEPVGCIIQMNQVLQNYPCDTIDVAYYRAGQADTVRVILGEECLLGVQGRDFNWDHKSYTFIKAMPAGAKYGWTILAKYVQQFGLIFSNKEAAKSIGGFGTIGSMFPSSWNWQAFWSMTAFLSIILAFMNFLPIPALDGGYVLFLLWEMITRRKPSDRFLEIANKIGFWLLILLLIFANGNDIIRLFK